MTDVLVIDEISMIENLQFERLNEVMKASRAGKATGPFGGVQVVVTGDVSHSTRFDADMLITVVLSTITCEALPALYGVWMEAHS
jgi:hypothetical protein